MRDNDDCLIPDEFLNGKLHLVFIFGIGKGGCFIQYEDRGVFQNGTCYGDALFFTTGKVDALFSGYRVVLFGEVLDKFITL